VRNEFTNFNITDLQLTNIAGYEYIMFSIMLIPMVYFIFYHIFDWEIIIIDSRKFFKNNFQGVIYVDNTKIPIGVKDILKSLNIKNVKSYYRIKNNRNKKINTHFSYIIYTKNNNFHLYFDGDRKGTRWYIYKKGYFDNKPICIDDNFYKIMKVINPLTFNKIEKVFKDKLSNQLFHKV